MWCGSLTIAPLEHHPGRCHWSLRLACHHGDAYSRGSSWLCRASKTRLPEPGARRLGPGGRQEKLRLPPRPVHDRHRGRQRHRHRLWLHRGADRGQPCCFLHRFPHGRVKRWSRARAAAAGWRWWSRWAAGPGRCGRLLCADRQCWAPGYYCVLELDRDCGTSALGVVID